MPMEAQPNQKTDSPKTDTKVADAIPENWVDTWAPRAARPYLRLARADRPIGTWLLLFPCLWGIALASPHVGNVLPDWRLVLLFTIGSFVMRGAGCTFNDIVDRDFDAQVARTQSRPIPSGAVPVEFAWMFLTGQALIGLAVLLNLNIFTVLLGFSALILVAVYPFTKRFTYWPQLFLGLAFNWGALMGWSAVTGNLEPAAIALYLAGMFWTIGYDTIYAHQDKEDDALIGVKSTALKFGENTQTWLYLFYGLTIVLLTIAGAFAAIGWAFYLILGLGAIHLGHQIASLDIHLPQVCLRLFRSNRDFGLLILAAIICGNLTA